jgi:hypothetical protein
VVDFGWYRAVTYARLSSSESAAEMGGGIQSHESAELPLLGSYEVHSVIRIVLQPLVQRTAAETVLASLEQQQEGHGDSS